MTRDDSPNRAAKAKEGHVDEDLVREHATKHAQATVEGDFKTAGGDLTPEAAEQAPDVMKAMPRELTSCEVSEVSKDGNAYVATIEYSSEDATTTVESTWEEREGRPRIVNLKVV
jgi:hypothetical protein